MSKQQIDELAERYMEGARLNFQAHGHLIPILAICGGPTDYVVQLKPGDWHPSDQLCAIAHGFGAVLPATHLVSVTEVWLKEFQPTEMDQEEADKLERGYLEARAAAGDPRVHTGLLVTVIDIKDLESSQLRSIDVDTGTEIQRFADMPVKEGDGYMPDRIWQAWKQGEEMAKSAPPDMDWMKMSTLLAAADLIEAVMFGIKDWSEN